jgi:hypothetical protein
MALCVLPAMKRRWIFCSIAAVQFPARSEAVIDPKMLIFSVCQAGVQRLEPFRSSSVESYGEKEKS